MTMKRVDINQPFDCMMGMMAWERYHEPLGGNGFAHYPAVLFAIFDRSRNFVTGDIQDIPGLDPVADKAEALALARSWIMERPEGVLEGLVRWVTD
jgi:hypothetical protein